MTIGLMFPGQGSQAVGMGKALTERFPLARETFEEADDVLGFALSRLCFEGPESDLQLTVNSQPALLTTSIAIWRVLRDTTSLTPAVLAGHSLGEYSALVVAGAIAFPDALRLVRQRGRYMQEAVPVGEGTMAAVIGVDPAVVEEVCTAAAQGQVVVPANFNGGGQVVISGHVGAVERASALVSERGGTARRLKVSAPFHSPLMAPAAKRLAADVAGIAIQRPKTTVISNVTARPIGSAEEIATLLPEQLVSPVRWAESMLCMREQQVDALFEVGWGSVLTSLARRILPGVKGQSVAQPEQIEELRAKLPKSNEPAAAGDWRVAADGSKLSPDGGTLMLPDGTTEEVTRDRWHFHADGTKVRKFGAARVIWPDGRLEALRSDDWLQLRNGAHVRRDFTLLLREDGGAERLDPAEWELSAHGTVRRKDGRRIIWADGMEWIEESTRSSST